MDFGTLLYTAQRNERNAKKEPVNVYRTSFAPPKKEVKESKALSANIQKFLARKEEEEKKKKVEETKKRDELLALRSQDGKAKKRVAAMLKRTKAANKAVIDDAIDNDNTAVTLGGPAQPDEDDYGYVSQEATAYYAKLMDKYNSAPPEEPLFSQKTKKGVVKDLNSTKDRVRNALLRAEEEEMMPHKRKRKSKDKSEKQEEDTGDQTISYASSDKRDFMSDDGEEVARKVENKPAKPRKPAPPPMDFNELLKIAQQKQSDPTAKLELKPKVKEEDEPPRPMTKKQRAEYERELEARRRREERDIARQKAFKERMHGSGKSASSNADRVQGTEAGRVQKVNREETGGVTQGRIPKIGDREDRRDLEQSRRDLDQPGRIPKVIRDDSGTVVGKLPKVNDSREERPVRAHSFSREDSTGTMRIPKVGDGREERRDSNFQPRSIPKLHREDSFTPGRIQKSVDRGKEERQDSFSKQPKVIDRDNKSRMQKVGDDDRREERLNGSQFKSSASSGKREEKYQQGYSTDRQSSQGSSSREERAQQKVMKDEGERFERPAGPHQRIPKFSSTGTNSLDSAARRLPGDKDRRDSVPGSRDRDRRDSLPGSRDRSDSVRNGIGQQSRPSVGNGAFGNNTTPSAFSKKMQESLSNKFQARKDVSDSAKPKRPLSVHESDDLFGDFDSSSKPRANNLKPQKPLHNLQNRARELDKKTVEQKVQSKPTLSQKTGTNTGVSSRLQDRGNEATIADKKLLVARDGRLPNQVENRSSLSQLPNGKLKPGQQPGMRPKQFPPADVRPKKAISSEVRPRQFPPPDVQRPKQFPPQDVRRKPKPPPVKRRIQDSDEEEYDSELDDFIDDGPQEEEDYSKHIREIFGYDKSRYANIDEEDDECMEANFAQVLKEEFVSTKMGILEDLEDIKMEQEEKRRKAMMKKKRLK